MAKPVEGQMAPGFEGVAYNGEKISLAGLRGKKVVLYFYPKDDTPGCTAEACSLRDSYESFLQKGFVVIGVSPDDVQSHKKFAAKYNLPFPLIADPDKKIIGAYGAWGEKNMYGKKVFGVMRTTFIINEKGIIEKVISKVNTSDHATQIFSQYS